MATYDFSATNDAPLILYYACYYNVRTDNEFVLFPQHVLWMM